MKKNQINHNALLHLIEADAVSIAIVKALGDTWALSVQVGDTLKVVMAKNSGKPRVWRKLDTLAKYLKDMGMETFHVDVTAYDPTQKSLRRPDSANTLKQTHKSHQSVKQQAADIPQNPSFTETAITKELIRDEAMESLSVSKENKAEPVRLNATDRAIELAKQRWEQRRASIMSDKNEGKT